MNEPITLKDGEYVGPGPVEKVYGYPINELVAFANLCRRHGITEDDLHDFCTNAVRGYEAGWNDFHVVVKNITGEIIARFGGGDVDALCTETAPEDSGGVPPDP